jgi:hypothetical protein
MSALTARRLTTPEEIIRFSSIIASAFANTAMTNAFIVEKDNTPPPYPSPSIGPSRRIEHFSPFIDLGFEHGAEFLEAGDWSAIAMWEPPESGAAKQFDTLNLTPLRREWRERLAIAKKKYLKERRHYHLGFLARNPDVEPAPGAITALMKPWLEKAKAEGVPVWLEATHDRAVRLYERHGFEMVEAITFGVGSVNEDGWPEEGGKGVTGYCMIAEP